MTDAQDSRAAARPGRPRSPGAASLLLRLRERLAEAGDALLTHAEAAWARLYRICARDRLDPVAMSLVVISAGPMVRLAQSAGWVAMPVSRDAGWRAAALAMMHGNDFWRAVLPDPAFGFWWLLAGGLMVLSGVAAERGPVVIFGVLTQLSFYFFATAATWSHLGFWAGVPYAAPALVYWWVTAHLYGRQRDQSRYLAEVEASMRLVGDVVRWSREGGLAEAEADADALAAR